ncbi:hypermethylated in cancer 2 protein-like isoform X2 [Ischnura elegans]|uniref:hypermethylated in cancer 2 protein-like isoform X2 n=1 Tax=Ischnura elegans TaxID=197161 RepID=UPI001ED86D7F|nr:hypermethylated in cancer 2 protein-like isoform X2 [Ischnura elegans]
MIADKCDGLVDGPQVVGLCDGFPGFVCSVCLDKLTDFKVFKDQCLESRSTFQQEFHLEIERAARRRLQNVQANQDPLVCSSSIKEESSEVEIIEIPVEDEVTVKKEEEEEDEILVVASPLHSEASDLDVETIDDDDNILCLGSKEEVGIVAVSPKSEEKASPPKELGSLNASLKRDRHGRFLKNKKWVLPESMLVAEPVSKVKPELSENRTTSRSSSAKESVGLRLADPIAPSPSTSTDRLSSSAGAAQVTQDDPDVAVHPLWLDSEEGTTAKSTSTPKRGPRWRDRSYRNRSRRRPRKVKQKVASGVNDVKKSASQAPHPASQSSVMLEKGGSSEGVSEESLGNKPRRRLSSMASVSSPEGPQKGEKRDSVSGIITAGAQLGVAKSSAGQHPLFDVETVQQPSEPAWKHQRRAAAAAPVYTETSILLSSGNTPQGFVDVGCLGSELKPRKKKKKKLSAYAPPVQSGDANTNPLIASQDSPDSKSKLVGRTVYKCSICGQTFRTWLLRREHRRRAHGGVLNRPKQAPCPICGRVFSSVGAMRSHELLHSGLRPFACNLCPMGYTRFSHLKRHMALSHKAKGDAAAD